MGVAGQAERLLGAVPAPGAETLVAAAWLHDIGYAEAIRDSGFHPLDGGLHLRRLGWPDRIAGLVAHHSGALCVAEARGLADRLSGFPCEESAVADALTYADQTVGPNGRVMDFEHRLQDMLRRHGPDSPNAAAHPRRAPLLRAAVQRVEQRLSRTGPAAAGGVHRPGDAGTTRVAASPARRRQSVSADGM